MGSLLKWLALAGLALAGLTGATVGYAGPEAIEPAPGRKTMAYTKTKPGSQAAIPPLDAAQPARTATATFALG